MKPRRLLMISHGFPPYYGGAEHAAGYLARAAAATGRWRVQALTSDIGGRLPAEETWEGVGVVRVPTRKKEWARHTVPELLSFLRAASRFTPAERPDWIIANCALPAGAVARRLARRFGVPYSVILQGSDVPGYQNARFGLVYRVIAPWLRRVWRDAASVVAVSEPLRELALRTWPGGRMAVIPNGVDLARFQSLEQPAGEHSRNWNTIVVLAQLIPRKGIQHLLDAVARLPAELRSRVRVRLCGVGPHEAALRAQAEAAGLGGQVAFAGLVAHDDVPGELFRAGVAVLPSLQEGWPLSVLEAMAAGCAVVATTVGGVPVMIRNGQDGLLVPPGDEAALAGALARVLGDPVFGARLGAGAAQRAALWAWPRIWEDYEAMFDGRTGASGEGA